MTDRVRNVLWKQLEGKSLSRRENRILNRYYGNLKAKGFAFDAPN